MIKRILENLAAAFRPTELPLAPGERRREAPSEARAQSGQAAEDAAVALLGKKGYRILCRNRVNRLGELDIVAREKDRIVFVEVRGRRQDAPVAARDTLTRHKLRTLARAAEAFLRAHRLHKSPARIDLIAVAYDAGGNIVDLEHIQGIAGPNGN